LLDTYHTIAAPTVGEYKAKGSKFIAYAYPVQTEGDMKKALDVLKKEHFKSRHHCFAFRLGIDGKRYRANDDGEPSGTAGRPILGQIDSFGLTNVFIVVVRYFGGTKLGTSGLKVAYRDAAKEALQAAEVVEKIVEKQFNIIFDYSVTSDVMNYLKKEDFKILETTYTDKSILRVSIRLNDIERFTTALNKIIMVKVKEVD
jgi:uncharacterized YigZ family protein